MDVLHNLCCCDFLRWIRGRRFPICFFCLSPSFCSFLVYFRFPFFRSFYGLFLSWRSLGSRNRVSSFSDRKTAEVSGRIGIFLFLGSCLFFFTVSGLARYLHFGFRVGTALFGLHRSSLQHLHYSADPRTTRGSFLHLS